jgi:uncharacterized protein YjbJ (UPF0337 family)
MKKLSLLIIAMFFVVTSAFAFQCPSLMKKFDAAVGTSKAPAAQVTEAKKLRAEGETLHKAGKHQESIDTLNKALKMIGA